jgi:hypothetical protein
VPDRSVSKRLDFDWIFLGFQDGEEMSLVRSVETFDQNVGLDDLVPATVFSFIFVAARSELLCCGLELLLTRRGISG